MSGKYFESFVEINSVATHVLQFGFEEPITQQNKASDEIIVVMISGNPGSVQYYEDFMSQIHSETKLSVIGLSHGGHCVPSKQLKMPSITENPDLYSLNGQIVHKMRFIEDFISKESKLFFIGHSIGCFIILELLHRYPDIKERVLHSVLIFPAIESMGDTSEAKKYKILFEWFKYPLLGLAHVFNLLSDNFKQKISDFFLKTLYNPPKCAVKSVTNLFNPHCLEALIHMALIEFQTVRGLNGKAIESNEKTVTFLYGEADIWCPIEYYERIHRLYPNSDIRNCLEDMDHAFVFYKDQTLRIGQMVVQILQQKL